MCAALAAASRHAWLAHTVTCSVCRAAAARVAEWAGMYVRHDAIAFYARKLLLTLLVVRVMGFRGGHLQQEMRACLRAFGARLLLVLVTDA